MIKAIRSSMFRGDMGCRHCDTGTNKTQEHLEVCTGFTYEQRGLKINEVKGKLLLAKNGPKLKALTNEKIKTQKVTKKH